MQDQEIAANHSRKFARRTQAKELESPGDSVVSVTGLACDQTSGGELSKKYPTVNLYGWVSAVVPGVLGTRDDEALVPLPNLDILHHRASSRE